MSFYFIFHLINPWALLGILTRASLHPVIFSPFQNVLATFMTFTYIKDEHSKLHSKISQKEQDIAFVA
jgi:hypothetical protein